MEAEEAKAKLEMESNTIPDRLATKLNVDYDLIGPIEADRGDPYALQVSQNILKYIGCSVKYGNGSLKYFICSALKNTDSAWRIS